MEDSVFEVYNKKQQPNIIYHDGFYYKYQQTYSCKRFGLQNKYHNCVVRGCGARLIKKSEIFFTKNEHTHDRNYSAEIVEKLAFRTIRAEKMKGIVYEDFKNFPKKEDEDEKSPMGDKTVKDIMPEKRNNFQLPVEEMVEQIHDVDFIEGSEVKYSTEDFVEINSPAKKNKSRKRHLEGSDRNFNREISPVMRKRSPEMEVGSGSNEQALPEVNLLTCDETPLKELLNEALEHNRQRAVFLGSIKNAVNKSVTKTAVRELQCKMCLIYKVDSLLCPCGHVCCCNCLTDRIRSEVVVRCHICDKTVQSVETFIL